MHYRQDNGFDMREISDEEYFESRSLHRWALAYGILGLVAVGFAIWLLFSHKFGYSILMWLLGQVSSFYSGVLHRRAHEVRND